MLTLGVDIDYKAELAEKVIDIHVQDKFGDLRRTTTSLGGMTQDLKCTCPRPTRLSTLLAHNIAPYTIHILSKSQSAITCPSLIVTCPGQVDNRLCRALSLIAMLTFMIGLWQIDAVCTNI